MASSRRQISSFNLSFLDIMFCGFGAVVLLVLIINSNTITQREEKHEDLRAEVERLELEREVNLESLQKAAHQLHLLEIELANTVQQQQELVNTIEQEKTRNLSLITNEKASAEIDTLKEALRVLADEKESLQAEIVERQETGEKVRRFEGEGHRQYLTGFQLGGKRVLILLDSSASMLDRTVVNIIRRKVMNAPSRKNAPKWQRAVKTVRWIIANLPQQSKVQLFVFNTEAKQVGRKTDGSWIPVNDSEKINSMLASLADVAPQGGTSLENCFLQINTLSAPPDNIILITDGLPTQGQKESGRATISGEGRVKLYVRAIKKLPQKTPVNTILFPMEGDPMAAMLFWKLAVDTSGSFFTPTQDWP